MLYKIRNKIEVTTMTSSKQHLMTGKMKDIRTLGKTVNDEIDIVFYGEKRLF